MKGFPKRGGDLSDTTYSSISIRKSTPPQNRRLNISIGSSKQNVDDFVGGTDFLRSSK